MWARSHSKNVVAHVVAGVVRIRGKRKTMLSKKLFHESTGAKLLTVALRASKVVTCYAYLANVGQHRIHPEKCVALSTLNIHFQQGDLVDSHLLADLIQRLTFNLNSA